MNFKYTVKFWSFFDYGGILHLFQLFWDIFDMKCIQLPFQIMILLFSIVKFYINIFPPQTRFSRCQLQRQKIENLQSNKNVTFAEKLSFGRYSCAVRTAINLRVSLFHFPDTFSRRIFHALHNNRTLTVSTFPKGIHRSSSSLASTANLFTNKSLGRLDSWPWIQVKPWTFCRENRVKLWLSVSRNWLLLWLCVKPVLFRWEVLQGRW